MYTDIFRKILALIAKASTALFNFITTMLNQSFFTHDFVKGTLNFFQTIGYILLLAGFVKSLITAVEQHVHGDGNDIGARCFSFLKAYGMLLFCRPIINYAHELVLTIVRLITASLSPDFTIISIRFNDIINGTGTAGIVFSIIFIIMLIVSVLMVFHLFKQYVVIYVQVLTGYLYVFDVAAGNDGAIGEWGRDVISGRLTFGLQLLCYSAGMDFAATGYNTNHVPTYFIAGVLLIGAASIPSILKRWGYSSGSSGGGLTNVAYMAAMVASRGGR